MGLARPFAAPGPRLATLIGPWTGRIGHLPIYTAYLYRYLFGKKTLGTFNFIIIIGYYYYVLQMYYNSTYTINRYYYRVRAISLFLFMIR